MTISHVFSFFLSDPITEITIQVYKAAIATAGEKAEAIQTSERRR